MDLKTTINETRREKEQLSRVIASLEEPQPTTTTAALQRGRNSMSAEERCDVSYPMKKYWAARPARIS
jgi:hypothetical protein